VDLAFKAKKSARKKYRALHTNSLINLTQTQFIKSLTHFVFAYIATNSMVNSSFFPAQMPAFGAGNAAVGHCETPLAVQPHLVAAQVVSLHAAYPVVPHIPGNPAFLPVLPMANCRCSALRIGH
jgi:hypothetical protein